MAGCDTGLVLDRLRSVPRGVAVGATVLLSVALAMVLVVLTGGDDDVEEVRVRSAEGVTTTTSRSTTSLAPTTTVEITTTTSAPATTVPSVPATTTSSTRRSAATTAPPPPMPPAPPFESSIETVTVEELGSSWNSTMGCPAPDQLRAVNVSHWGYDGAVRQGRIIVAAAQAERMVAVFRDVYAARFPIQRMVPIAAYGGDDQASMRANNTSGFNCRTVAGSSNLSQHGLGLAVDVNPLMNPYVQGSRVDPPEGARWADRSRTDAGMIKPGDAVVDAFDRQGWAWGGYWSSGQDYQHFSASGG